MIDSLERKDDMKVLMVNGSPHKEGCTYTALKEVAGALEKYDIESEIGLVMEKLPVVSDAEPVRRREKDVSARTL